MKLFKNKKGFTLLELLIVLTIIGVLAGLMFPVLAQQVERSRAQEALTALGTSRQATLTLGTAVIGGATPYVGITFAATGYTPGGVAGGQTSLFAYGIAARDAGGGAGSGFLITATRNGIAANIITMNECGAITAAGDYVGLARACNTAAT